MPVHPSASFERIIALDLGKFKTVACVMDTATREHVFETIVMSPGALHDLVVRHATSGPSKTLVVYETCDAAGWVHDLLVPLGVAVTVACANGEAWKWRRLRRKTDRDDALKLARHALLDQLVAVHMPDAAARQKRRLMLHRRSLIERRTASRNAIRSVFNQQGIALPRGQKLWTVAGLELLRSYARPIEQCAVEELWRGRLAVELALLEALKPQLKALDDRLDEMADDRMGLLRTLKGVGPRLAEAVVLYLDDPDRFGRANEVASYAGLVPKQVESGEMSRFGHIDRRGPSLLRSLLVEAAWCVWKYNPWAQAWVNKISRGSRSKRKIAIVALARKLLITLWAMLRTNKPFRMPPSAVAAV